MKNKKTRLVYFGHHKCASAWINQLIAKICAYLDISHQAVFTPSRFQDDLEKFVEENDIQFLTYGNANYHYVKQLNNYKGFHVVRDPRDVLVSAYFSHQYSHPTNNWPELAQHRSVIQSLPKDEGLLLDMAFNKPFLDDMLSWDYQTVNVLQFKYEDFIRDPFHNFITVFKYLGIMVENPLDYLQLFSYKAFRRVSRQFGHPVTLHNPKLSNDNLAYYLNSIDFKQASGGREKGQEDPKSHYRKGIPGDWINHFKPQHIAYFVNHYNPVLLKLGYETDPNWAEQYFPAQP